MVHRGLPGLPREGGGGMKLKTYYLVGAVERNKDLEIPNTLMQASLDLSWYDGMIGVCPVFRNKKAAKKYAGKRFEVFTFKAIEHKKEGVKE